MKLTNSEYWRKRAEILEAQKTVSAGKVTADVERQFQLAQKRIDEQIEQWYGRFAKNNQITLAEARGWLTGKDLAEFKWDVTDYIKYGKEAAIDPALIKQLENASARFHVSKLEALKMKTQFTVESLYGQTGDKLTGAFGQIYQNNYYHTAFELEKGLGIGWDVGALNQRHVESVLSKPWTLDKTTFSDRLWTQKQSLIDEVHTQLTQTMILGKSPDDAIKAIADKFGASKKNAARLVQTEAAYFMNEAQKAAFEGLDVEEFEVVGTLDGITCHVCGGLDGSHLPMSQFEAGVTAPPYHPNCRCCIAPYFDDNEGERIARDEDGKRYYISQEMTFKDWKEKFVDGGGKSGLKPIDNGGVVSWVKDDLKNSAVSGIIEMGTLDKSLGTVHADQMREILNDSPDNVKGVWNNYADRLQVETIHSKKGAFCNNRGISVDIDHVSHEEKYMGEIAKKPYYTVYHEFGHNIDRIASQERGEYRSLADTFKSSIHTGNNGLGYTLTEMLEQEGTQRVSDIWAALKKEAIAAGGKASDIKKFKAYQAISVEIRAKPVLSTTDISDMWDGITKEVVRPHYGHGKSYWKTHTVGVEAFAEMFSATVMNPESVAQIQYYFPKSYEIFEEIISELGVIK